MATVLERREFDQDGISIVLLRGPHATAIALDALPSVAVSEMATRLVRRLREEGVVSGDAMTGLAGGFNRSMQHTNHRVGGRSVANEATATDLLFRQPEGADVGALEARLDAQRDWQAL